MGFHLLRKGFGSGFVFFQGLKRAASPAEKVVGKRNVLHNRSRLITRAVRGISTLGPVVSPMLRMAVASEAALLGDIADVR